MKRFILIIIISGVFSPLLAQDILDGAYEKDIRDGGKDRLIQSYQHVRHVKMVSYSSLGIV